MDPTQMTNLRDQFWSTAVNATSPDREQRYAALATALDQAFSLRDIADQLARIAEAMENTRPA